MQTGKGYLQPNDASATPSVVKYGLDASNLNNMTATGTAQASPFTSPRCSNLCQQKIQELAPGYCSEIVHSHPEVYMQVYSQIYNESYAFWGGNTTLNYSSPVSPLSSPSLQLYLITALLVP